jgi:hypothetical protein
MRDRDPNRATLYDVPDAGMSRSYMRNMYLLTGSQKTMKYDFASTVTRKKQNYPKIYLGPGFSSILNPAPSLKLL